MKKLFLFLLIFFISNVIYSQTLSENLTKIGAKYAEKYLQPFTDGIGIAFNSHFIDGRMQKVGKLPIEASLYAGIKVSAIALTDEDRFFNLDFSDTIVVSGQKVLAHYNVKNAPTVFGPTTPAVATGYYYANGVQVPAPDLTLVSGILNTKFYPFIIPQIGLGSFYGADVIVRFLPRVNLSNYGDLGYSGVVFRYNLSYLLGGIPFELGLHGGFQNFSVRNDNGVKYFNANGYVAGLQFAKKFFLVTIYGGGQYEEFNLELNYNYKNPSTGLTIPISISQKSGANFRGVVGASLTILTMMANLDLNFGKRFVITGGFGVTL